MLLLVYLFPEKIVVRCKSFVWSPLCTQPSFRVVSMDQIRIHADPWRIRKEGSGINHSGSTALDDRNFRSYTCTFLARGPAEGKRGKRIWEEKSSIPGNKWPRLPMRFSGASSSQVFSGQICKEKSTTGENILP
jgi:hypothetical protein